MDTLLLQSIFESSFEGIILIDSKGIIIKANTAAEKIFNYSKGELQHIKIENLIPEHTNNIHNLFKEKYVKSKSFINLKNILAFKKGGNKFLVDINIKPIVIDTKNINIVFFREILKKEETEKLLIESKRRLNSLLGKLPGFVYRSKNDKNWTIEYVSKGIYEVTGYTISDFLEKEIYFGKIILKKDKEYVWNTIQKAIKKKKPYSIHYRIITKTGEIKYLWEKGEGVFDSNNKVIALEGFIQDISNRILLEKALKTKHAKNKALLEALPDTMIVLDLDGNYLDFNSPKSQNLFKNPENIIGKNIKNTLPNEIYKKTKKTIESTIQKKHIHLLEYKINDSDYYEARIVPLNNHNVLAIIRDVTEKKKAEHTLEIRNRALAAVGNSIIIVDAQKQDYPIIYTNKAFTEITGYKQSEVLGKNCRFLQNDDRDQTAVTTMNHAIKNGQSCEVILRNYKKDGSLFYNELTITPIYNDQQKLTHFIGASNDVTNRRIEELLKEKMSNILKMIAQEQTLENIADSVITIIEDNLNNFTGIILLLNNDTQHLKALSTPHLPESFYHVMGKVNIQSEECPCSTSALTGKKIIIENLSNEHRWENYKAIALKNGFKSSWSFPIFSSEEKVIGVFTLYGKIAKTPVEFEYKLIKNIVNLLSIAIEQETIRVELFQNRKKLAIYAKELEEKVKKRTNDLKATVQKLVETNLSLEDQITETKLAEQKALDNQALFWAIAKNFPKGAIAVVDDYCHLIFIDGNELLNFEFSNSTDTYIHINDINILNNDQKTFVKDLIKKTIHGQHLSLEVKFRGHTYNVNTTPLYDADKNINKALFVFNNITEHKQVELNILNALRKEQELNELKSRFVSMASHEFRTPLSTILSSATLIEKQNGIGRESKRIKNVSRIKSNVKNMVNILDDFLSLSRLEDGKLSMTPEKFDIIDFTKLLIDEIKLSKKEGQTIKLKHESKKIRIYQDTKIIRIVINNLISNAIKYSPKNTDISISISSNNNLVNIEVKDQGMGITDEDQEHLFERFFRAKNASHIQGTGLGLYIVKQYTNLMGGKIFVKSKDRKGTTFMVEFPTNANY